MAILHRYVDTAAAAGGNGTTTALSGATCAYQSLSAALGAEQTNLVAAGNSLVIHCAASTGVADPSPGGMGNWTTDATHYLTIQCDLANRTPGRYDTAKYHIAGGGYQVFNYPPQYTRFVGLAVGCFPFDDRNQVGWSLQGQGCVIDSCVAISLRNGASGQNYGTGCVVVHTGIDQTADPSIIANCVFYDLAVPSAESQTANCINAVNANTVVYNTTIVGAGTALIDGYSRLKAVNNLVTGCASFGNPRGAGTDYNATDLGAASGASGATHDRVNQTFAFVDAASKKYQLAATDTGAKGYGSDLSADATFPIANDVAGTARTTPWDIGAFVFKPSGSGAVNATGTASSGASATGAAAERMSATGAAASGAGASGTATERAAATGTAGSGARASGTASERAAATGSVASGAAAAGSATERIAGTGAAAEGERASGSGAESIAGTGSAGSAAAASTTGTSMSGTGSAGSGSGAAGSGTQAQSGSGAAAEGEAASGSASTSESATGSARSGAAAAGTGAIGQPATGAAHSGAGTSGTASPSESASGAAGSAAAAAGVATVRTPGAADRREHRVTITISPRYRSTVTTSRRYRTTFIQ